MRRSKYILPLLILILVSCGETPFYQKVYSFKNRTWSVDVKPEYVIDVKDESKEYDFELMLRTTTDYKYSNLWVFMKTTTPGGEVAREPFEIRITNEDGSWIGTKSGTIVETPITFRSRKLPEKGKYTFVIEQAITENTVDEVLDLQFTVDYSRSEN